MSSRKHNKALLAPAKLPQGVFEGFSKSLKVLGMTGGRRWN
jgi:hypothetical protein